MRRIIFIIICTIVSSFATVNDWAARSGFQLLAISSSAERTAMGGVGAAIGSNFALYSNPANYALDTNYRISFEHLWRITHTDLNINRFEIFVPVRTVFMALSAQNHTISNIFIRDIFPEAPPQPGDLSAAWQFSQVSLAVGVRRTPTFDWAISAGFAFDKFLDEAAYAFIMNAGFLWKLLDNDLRLGLAFNNFGITTPMINEDDGRERWGSGEELPTTIRGGAHYSRKIRSVRYGFATDLLYWHLYDPQEGRAKNFGRRIQIPLGIEISPIDFLALRGGKTILADYNIFNFGIGIDTRLIDFDISAAINRYETSVELEWIAGISLGFGGR
ncbi:MAG: hypothetical protein FWE23_07750 [Chitinivibrionia bacterium]|nr:hypothetical protein [Chitinivibrionia bacterium]